MIPLYDAKAEAYAIHIQELVKQLKSKNKAAIAENEKYRLSDGDAISKYGGRIGEVFYLFPNDAPSKEIIEAYEKVKPYYGEGEFAVSFEQHLSHRRMTVIFDGKDLVIRADRSFLVIDKLTESNLVATIAKAKESYQIDWNNAKIFIFPYKTIYFYISDSFEIPLAGGRADLRNPDNWFTIPFKEDFDSIDYKALRKQIRQYAEEHPLPEIYNF